MRPGTSCEEDKNEADNEYFESDAVIKDVEEGEPVCVIIFFTVEGY